MRLSLHLPGSEARPPRAVADRTRAWPGRRVDDTPITFADIQRLPEPEWADTNPASRARFWPGRYTVGALVPAGQLAAVPLTAPDDTEAVIADVRAVMAGLPTRTAKAEVA